MLTSGEELKGKGDTLKSSVRGGLNKGWGQGQKRHPCSCPPTGASACFSGGHSGALGVLTCTLTLFPTSQARWVLCAWADSSKSRWMPNWPWVLPSAFMSLMTSLGWTCPLCTVLSSTSLTSEPHGNYEKPLCSPRSLKALHFCLLPSSQPSSIS